MLSDTEVEDHYSPSVRLVNLEKNGSCGFHLTRSKWDPYPWVNSVVSGTAAELAGIKTGDCLLEVNGEDVLGRRISDVAEIVKSKANEVSLLLWNAGVDSQCSPEAICCGPMPTNLQRLSACMSTILAFLECPVCLDTIPPPTYQCDNGHLICMRCRTKSERCPVCRLRFGRGRSLLADQIYNALIDAFNLREEPAEAQTAKMQQIFKFKTKKIPEIKVTSVTSHANKFLARIVGKSSSVDNLTESNFDQNEGCLRAKSLSTQEIFLNSPVVSRASSVNRLRVEKNTNYLNPEFRSASCHGSFESLQKNDEVISFYCPFTATCSLIKGNVIEHFQQFHEGPLVQYFKPNLRVDFAKILEQKDLCFVIQTNMKTFFLKIEVDRDERVGNVLLWSWLLGTGKAAKEYDMQVQVLVGDKENIVISVRNNVFSLNCTSYQEVKEMKKGLILNAKSFITNNFAEANIIFQVDILKSDYL